LLQKKIRPHRKPSNAKGLRMDDGRLDAWADDCCALAGCRDRPFRSAFGATHDQRAGDKIVEVVIIPVATATPGCRFVKLQRTYTATVDYPGRERRFDVVYHLLSPTLNARIRLRAEAGATTQVPSIIEVVSGRRLVRARNLRSLRRDLHRTSGHAAAVDRLRFRRPSAAQGFPDHRLPRGALRRPGEAGAVRARPSHQEFRKFDFLSPWRAPTIRCCPATRRRGRRSDHERSTSTA